MDFLHFFLLNTQVDLAINAKTSSKPRFPFQGTTPKVLNLNLSKDNILVKPAYIRIKVYIIRIKLNM